MTKSMASVVYAISTLLLSGTALAEITALISTAKNLRVENWSAKSNAGEPTAWSIEKTVLHGGKQEGVDLIKINNGVLTFTVVPSRGMSILRADMGDIRLGWDSPVKEIVNPLFINLEARDGLGWLDGFNEWLPRAGIAWAGHPGMDGKNSLTLHGKIGNIPASEVSVEIEEGSPKTIHIRGTVQEVSMFGTNLELQTDISTKLGSNHIVVSDTIINRSAQPQEFQIIYHADYGEPLLEEGSRFVAAAKEVRPLDGVAAKALETYADYGPPLAGFAEEVYGITPFGNGNNMTTIMLRNAPGDKAVTMTYSVDELPYMALWKNTGAKGEAFVTGLEPATGFPANRSVERKAGRVPVLQPGASRSFTIDFAILDDSASVQSAEAEIKAIQDSRQTVLNPETIKSSPAQ